MALFLASSVLALWGASWAIRQKRPGAWLLLLLLLVYPAIYYVVYPHARYRHPVEPEMVVLADFIIAEGRSRGAELRSAGRVRAPAPTLSGKIS
jgi:hypothetical protein